MVIWSFGWMWMEIHMAIGHNPPREGVNIPTARWVTGHGYGMFMSFPRLGCIAIGTTSPYLMANHNLFIVKLMVYWWGSTVGFLTIKTIFPNESKVYKNPRFPMKMKDFQCLNHCWRVTRVTRGHPMPWIPQMHCDLLDLLPGLVPIRCIWCSSCLEQKWAGWTALLAEIFRVNQS